MPNLRHLDIPDPFKERIVQIASEHPEMLQAAQRGRVPWSDTIRAAQDMGVSMADLPHSPLSAMNEVEITGARMAMVNMLADQVNNPLWSRAAMGVGRLPVADKAALVVELLNGAETVAKVRGASATAGRALNALKIDLNEELSALARGNLSLPEREQLAQRALARVGGGRQQIPDTVLENYARVITEGDPASMVRFLKGLEDPGWWNRLSVLRYSGMLASTTTHIVQAMSNSMGLGSAVATRLVAAGPEMALARLAGREPSMYLSELGPMVRGIATTDGPRGGVFTGAAQGLRDAAFILQHGVHPSDVSRIAEELGQRPGEMLGFGAEHISMFGRHPFQGRSAAIVDALAEGPLRLLSAGDAVIRETGRGMATASEAYRLAMHEGLRGEEAMARAADVMQNIQDYPHIAEAAENWSRRVVMQERRWFTDQFLMPGLRNNKFFVGGASQVSIPFIRTPTNIALQAGEHSPLGLIAVGQRYRELGAASVARRAAEAAGRTGMTPERIAELAAQREVAEAYARVALGTGIMLLGGGLTQWGMLTGPRPSKPGEAGAEPMGWQQWAGHVADKYVSLPNAGPLGMVLASGGSDLYGKLLRGELRGEDLANVGNLFTSQTSARFLRDVLDYLGDPDKEKNAWEATTENIASSYVPWSSATRLGQRVAGMPPPDPHTPMEAMQANLPIVGGNVRPRLNIVGQPDTSQVGGPAALALPLRTTQENDPHWLQEVRRLHVPLATIPKPAEMTREQHYRYREVAGQLTERKLSDTVTSSDYLNPQTKDARRRELLQHAIGSARDQARGQLGIQGTPTQSSLGDQWLRAPSKYDHIPTDEIVRGAQEYDRLMGRRATPQDQQRFMALPREEQQRLNLMSQLFSAVLMPNPRYQQNQQERQQQFRQVDSYGR